MILSFKAFDRTFLKKIAFIYSIASHYYKPWSMNRGSQKFWHLRFALSNILKSMKKLSWIAFIFSIAVITTSPDLSTEAGQKTDEQNSDVVTIATNVHRTINLPVINGKIQLTEKKTQKRKTKTLDIDGRGCRSSS